MALHFLSLSEDILLEICAYISAIDLLSLKQTCRVLHAFGGTDYIWHQLKVDLPLDIAPDVDIKSLAGFDLQRIIIRALRLEHNWRRPVSQIMRSTRIWHGDIIYEMQLLPGAKWLLTLSRGPTSTWIALWCLTNPSNVYRATSFDIPGGSKCSAAVRKGHDEVTVAVIVSFERKEFLNIYTIPLEDRVDSDHSLPTIPRLRCSISRPEGRGVFSEVHTYEHVVAATIAKFVDISRPPSYQIMFLNTLTAARVLVNLALPEDVGHLRFKLYPRHVVLAGVRNHIALVVRIYDLPLEMLTTKGNWALMVKANGTATEPRVDNLGPIVAEYETHQMPLQSDYNISTDSNLHLSSLSFHPSSNTKPGNGFVSHFPLDFTAPGDWSPVTDVPVYTFPTPANTSVDIVCLGKTGRRAVWLERSWDTDEFRLMKMTFSPDSGERPLAGVLLPQHLALPFLPQACHSLAFDEVTGRVCLGLHTGELYILDFL